MRIAPLHIRLAVVLVLGALAFWWVLSLTIAQVSAARRPNLALSWSPANATAQAGAAALAVGERPTRENLRKAQTLARRALRREPVNVVAVRTLGLVAGLSNDAHQAERLFRYAERLSRRDTPTQLWLIEARVRQDDIAGALQHYDRALRTTVAVRRLLIPILVKAVADPTLGRALGTVMRDRQNWWLEAADQITRGTPKPASLPVFLEALKLRMDNDQESQFVQIGLTRLVDAGDYAAAFRLYRSATGHDGATLKNGDFSGQEGFAPLDWRLIEEPYLMAVVRLRQGDPALFLSAENGRGGEVARQLIGLAPGEYHLTALVGNSVGDSLSRPQVTITCAGLGGEGISSLRFPETGQNASPIALNFRVPTRCPAQWLALQAASSVSDDAETPWIDGLRLQKR